MLHSKHIVRLGSLCLGLFLALSAQEARVSAPATTEVSLNGKPVSIDYSRPMMRGRKIMGGVVPYGEVWRTGANEATMLKTAVSLDIGRTKVPAGKYTLYTLPSESGWKLIINKQTGQWGTEYDPSQDLARVDLVRTALSKPAETFTMSFEKKGTGTADLVLTWEITRLAVSIKAQ